MLNTEALALIVGETPSWQPMDTYSPDDCLFNANHVLHAYEEGKQQGFDHGMNSLEQGIARLLKQNQSKVAKQCHVVLDFLRQRDLQFSHVFLQTEEWNEMKVIMLIEEESFLREEFDQVYDLTHAIEVAEETCGLNLSFSFMPDSPSFDRLCLNADGYTLRLNQQNEPITEHISN